MASQIDPIALYFASHAGFRYNANATVSAEFDRLIAFLGYGRGGKAFRRERTCFTGAFVNYVNTIYGEGRATLAQWQDLCRVCRIAPMPTTITKCRQELRKVYVNIFDAIDALRTGGQARRFRDLNELRNYTANNHKVIARHHAKAGGALRDLLRRLF